MILGHSVFFGRFSVRFEKCCLGNSATRTLPPWDLVSVAWDLVSIAEDLVSAHTMHPGRRCQPLPELEFWLGSCRDLTQRDAVAQPSCKFAIVFARILAPLAKKSTAMSQRSIWWQRVLCAGVS